LISVLAVMLKQTGQFIRTARFVALRG